MPEIVSANKLAVNIIEIIWLSFATRPLQRRSWRPCGPFRRRALPGVGLAQGQLAEAMGVSRPTIDPIDDQGPLPGGCGNPYGWLGAIAGAGRPPGSAHPDSI